MFRNDAMVEKKKFRDFSEIPQSSVRNFRSIRFSTAASSAAEGSETKSETTESASAAAGQETDKRVQELSAQIESYKEKLAATEVSRNFKV